MKNHCDGRCERTRYREVVFREFYVVVKAFIRFLEHRTESKHAQEVASCARGTQVIEQGEPVYPGRIV